ncbi:hypothetical protein EXM56_11995 [Clostridium botulinum]|uniref:Uncharacterized protein n=1 Tax=Clostridium botulinum TaxID=1491 RepID=A0A6G4CR04_CLOBO|nr:hypothetical protein [Clostridium botulinum]NEZ98380.1 hypothetical protein [Clostridium botulinum]NFA30061.1 hypothetical protein [Clostridium botulinum]NFA86439.1 hypothetical protein [Clostridium botulinum]NFB05100.1 hypothetical protein [Clostridium botulinum]
MKEKSDLSGHLANAPIIKIKILEFEIQIRVLFSMRCCEIMFNNYNQGDNYRLAFAKAVFHMYQNTDNKISLTEDEFLSVTEENLKLILNKILEKDSRINFEYDKYQEEDIYERFYKANKDSLKSSIEKFNKTIEEVSKKFNSLNKSLVTPFSSVINNIPKLNFFNFQSDLMKVHNVSFTEIASVLSSIPKPTINMKDIISPIQVMVESLQNINGELVKSLNTQLFQMSESVKSLMESMDFSLLTYRKEWSEQRETLLKYGWFYSEELPEEVINYIHDRRGELSTDDVDDIIVEYFRKNRCQALKNIVKGWEKLLCFHCRSVIFHEALVNHSRKYFNSSVTLLTVHTEGVITDFVRESLKNPRFRAQKAIDDIKKELDENIDISIYEYEVFNDVIERIEEAFNENFSLLNPDATSNKSRHKIAHGHVYEKENEVNSLKRFLYLNEIYYLFLLLINND